MNDELQLTEEELESMADKLIEQAAGADIAEQQETELIKAPRKSSKKKEQAPDNRPPEERLKELFEKGKKAGKLTAKDLELLNELNLEAEAIDRFYEDLDKAGIPHEEVRTDEYTGKRFFFFRDPDNLPIEIYEGGAWQSIA